MTFRKLLRWIFSALSAVFAMILAPNIEKLLAAKGWDTFLVSLPDPGIGGLGALASNPLIDLSAALVIGITLGLWVDSALSVLDGRRGSRLSKWQALGQELINLAHVAQDRRTSYIRQNSSDVFAAINATRVKLGKRGFPFPATTREMSANHCLWLAERYFLAVGHLLLEGLREEAQITAMHLTRSLPTETYEEENERI